MKELMETDICKLIHEIHKCKNAIYADEGGITVGVMVHTMFIRNFTPSCSWDDEADCQKNVVC